MPSRSALIASDPDVEAAGQLALRETGSAVAAVVQSYFHAAGLLPGVLLSPMAILTASVGADARVFDGRLRQPGLGAKRPRGFLPEQAIPVSARLAVAVGVQAALVALAYDKSVTPSAVAKAGVVAARKAGARRRAAVIDRIRTVGAAAFSEASLAHPLLAIAAAGQGGMLTASDLRHVHEVDQPAVVLSSVGDERILGTDWPTPGTGKAAGMTASLAICAVDAHGRFAGLYCHHALEGIDVSEIELIAPLAAVPVIRGVTRVQPGSALPCRMPLTVRVAHDGVPCEIAIDLSGAAFGREGHYALRQQRGRRTVQITRGSRAKSARN